MNDERIEKYLNGLCTPEEAREVLQFLQENPDHPYLLKEWNNADASTPLPENYTQEIYDVIEAATKTPRKKTINLFWKLSAAACIAVIIFSLSFFLLRTNKSGTAVLAGLSSVQDTSWKKQLNTGNYEMEIVLADGSKVKLAAGASVQYRNDFNHYNRREIYMNGRVFFKVAKNKQRPFVVYSQQLSTTALGTAFSVSAIKNSSRLNIQLFEGKVVVALRDSSYPLVPRSYYLLPGQALSFDAHTMKGTIYSFTGKPKTVANTAAKNYPASKNNHASYMFNNQTLSDVLDHLSNMYNTEIKYSKSAIGNIYFIGQVDPDDSLEKIINDIAILNKLSVTKQNGTFILRKK